MTWSMSHLDGAVLSIVVLSVIFAPAGWSGAAAIESVEDCRDLVRSNPKEIDAYRSYWVLARQRNQWGLAIEGLEELLAEDPGQPRALLYLGMILSDRGESRAEQVLTRAAEAFAGEQEPTGEVYSRLGLAHWLDRRDRIVEAGAQRGLALQVADGSGIPILVARAKLARGWQRCREKDFATAREDFLAVERIAFPDGPWDVRVGALNGLGYTDWATGRFRSAAMHYRREAAVGAESGDLYQETSASYNVVLMESTLARTPADLERIDDAVRTALDAARRSGHRELESRLRLMLAEPHDGSQERRRQASNALAAARGAAIPELELQAERALAAHDLAAGQISVDEAIDRLRELVNRAQGHGNLHEEISGRLALAGVVWASGDREGGITESLAALDRVDELRALQTADEERARIASTWSHAFYQPIGWLLATDEPDDLQLAVQVMERLRAHGLVDLLEAADAPSPGPIRLLPISIEAVQAALKPDEILVSYQLADRFDLMGRVNGGSWLVVITPGGVSAHPLPDLSEIEVAVDVYLGLVRKGDAREKEAAHRLFEMVLAPAFHGPIVEPASLVVVPDGILAGLPFAALRTESDGPPLVEHLTISLTPSISRWMQDRAPQPAESPSGCLGVADPVIAEEAEDRWQPLPHARAEVRRACRRLGGGSQALTGASATESAIKGLLDTPFQILHFAAHAEVDRADPSKTAIRLGADPPGEDGFFRIAEISELELPESMVILSACQSAGGVVLQGEGVLGLTRAFFEGGARTVLGNLWPVFDRDASALVDRFYRHLIAGASASDALARAQRDRRAAGDPTAAWAALVVLGDGDFMLTTERRRWTPWRIALACIAAIAGLAAFRWAPGLVRRRRK